MKIGITGTTSGIGNALKNKLLDHVLSFDREDGDIHNCELVYEKLKDCDCFINNAYDDKVQVRLLNMFFKKWKDSTKKIISIGSASSSYPPSGTPNKKYQQNKIHLKNTHRSIVSSNNACKSFLINFGLVDTKMTVGIEKEKLSVDQAIDKILYVLNSDVYIPEIYIYA